MKPQFKAIKQQIHKLLLWLLKPAVILVLIIVFLFFADNYQGKVERRYGFKVVTPDLSIYPRVEPLMLNFVDSGGVFEQAGFKAGDIILKQDYYSVCGFKRSLDKTPGTKLWLEVVALEDFEPHQYLRGECRKRRIEFIAP